MHPPQALSYRGFGSCPGHYIYRIVVPTGTVTILKNKYVREGGKGAVAPWLGAMGAEFNCVGLTFSFRIYSDIRTIDR